MKLPVLRINDFHIEKFKSLRGRDGLKLTSQKYFDLGRFKKNTFFIDMNGKRYEVVDVIKRRRSWNPLNWFAPSPIIIVDIEVSKPKQLTLDQIRKLIIEPVIKNSWYRQGGESKEKFLGAFNSFQSVTELFDNISFYGKYQG